MAVFNKNGYQISSVYAESELSLNVAYGVNGDVVYRKDSHRDYSNYTITDLFTYSVGSTQSFAIYEDKIAQVVENDSLYIIDMVTHNKIKSVAMDMGHGNSCQFSTEFYDESDEFPLFYIRNSGIWVYRIVDTNSQLIKKYSFPTDVIATYVAGFGLDSEHNRLYTVSYTQGDYISRTGLVRVCAWDTSIETENGDGTFSPTYLTHKDYTWWDKYSAIQGCCYHDGYLFVGNGYTNITTQFVVMFDTSTLDLSYEIDVPGGELEGCAWYNDDYLVTAQRSYARYKKVVFAET